MATAPPHRTSLVLGFFAVLAALILIGIGKVLAGFVTPILLGGFVAVLTYKYYRLLRDRLHGRSGTAAIAIIIAVNLVLILPVTILVMLLIDQAASLVKLLQRTDVHAALAWIRIPARFDQMFPSLGLAGIDLEKELIKLVRRVPSLVATHGAQVIGGLANLVVGFFFMLFAMFYFYTDGEALVEELKFLSPLPDRYDQAIIEKFKGVIDATFRGHMLTALAQGIVTGIGLAITGIPGAVFWGAVAAVLALLPLIGAGLVWVPAALYLFAAGDTGWGLFMLGWGLLVVSLIDNVIRPWVMRGSTELSAVLLLFSILGGVKAFGFLGILLGPLLFALFATLVELYKALFTEELAEQNVIVPPA